jgi:ABC-type branched-subunit amino acid transport system ATPase component
MPSSDPDPDLVLELDAAVFPAAPDEAPVDLKLRAGGFAYLQGYSIALPLLGIEDLASGAVRFRGRAWEERSVAAAEDARRTVGTVVNPHSHPSRIWISNLDIDENVLLASQFDPSRGSGQVALRAAELAREFGLGEELPTGRPAGAAATDLVLAQWVRAFLREPLVLLVLEEPLAGAPPASAEALWRGIERVRGEGTAVLWVGEERPVASFAGSRPEDVLD